MMAGDEQINAAAEAIYRSLMQAHAITDVSAVDSPTWRHAAKEALAAASSDALVRWTPHDGPLAAAIANLPDGHPVTIRGQWGELHCTVDRSPSGTWLGNDSLGIYFQTREPWDWSAGGWPVGDASSITSASWLPPAPAWDGALVVVDGTDDLLWRGADGLYRPGAIGYSRASTAAEIEHQDGPVTVLIDADGNYVEVPHD